MDAQRRRAIVATAVMLGGAGAAVWARPRRHLADQLGIPDLERLFPAEFGDWRVDASLPVILPSPDVQALLNKIYNQVLTRTYVNVRTGERIMLSVAYGGDQSDGTSAHRPEGCYPAQGFAVRGTRAGRLELGDRMIPGRHLMSSLGTRHEPITYWVVVGGEVVTTGIGQKLAQLRYGVRGLIADGMLVRVSSIDAAARRGHALHERYLTALYGAVDASARPRIFGSS